MLNFLGQVPLRQGGGDAHHILEAGVSNIGQLVQQLGQALDVPLPVVQRYLVAEIPLLDGRCDQGFNVIDERGQLVDHVLHGHQQLACFIMGTNGDGDIQIAFCQVVGYLQRLIDGGNDAADEDDAKPGRCHYACCYHPHHGEQHGVIPGLGLLIFGFGDIQLQVDQLGYLVADGIDGAIKLAVKIIESTCDDAALG